MKVIRVFIVLILVFMLCGCNSDSQTLNTENTEIIKSTDNYTGPIYTFEDITTCLYLHGYFVDNKESGQLLLELAKPFIEPVEFYAVKLLDDENTYMFYIVPQPTGSFEEYPVREGSVFDDAKCDESGCRVNLYDHYHIFGNVLLDKENDYPFLDVLVKDVLRSEFSRHYLRHPASYEDSISGFEKALNDNGIEIVDKIETDPEYKDVFTKAEMTLSDGSELVIYQIVKEWPEFETAVQEGIIYDIYLNDKPYLYDAQGNEVLITDLGIPIRNLIVDIKADNSDIEDIYRSMFYLDKDRLKDSSYNARLSDGDIKDPNTFAIYKELIEKDPSLSEDKLSLLALLFNYSYTNTELDIDRLVESLKDENYDILFSDFDLYIKEKGSIEKDDLYEDIENIIRKVVISSELDRVVFILEDNGQKEYAVPIDLEVNLVKERELLPDGTYKLDDDGSIFIADTYKGINGNFKQFNTQGSNMSYEMIVNHPWSSVKYMIFDKNWGKIAQRYS